MKLNKTQRAVLRYIFGFNDGMVSSKGTMMPLVRNSREHTFAKELAANGLADIVKQGDFLFVRAAHQIEPNIKRDKPEHGPKRETLEQAGYTYVQDLGHGEHLLRDSDGKGEVWFVNDGHASYGLLWNGHDLEFARSLPATIS